jgi:hypothetical protein
VATCFKVEDERCRGEQEVSMSRQRRTEALWTFLLSLHCLTGEARAIGADNPAVVAESQDAGAMLTAYG